MSVTIDCFSMVSKYLDSGVIKYVYLYCNVKLTYR